ncbi:FecR family protein [Sphingobacterium bovistauri]|uniref:FecR family protein n=1 Tax=Sphingobacterium bovistauri TaxID=2781959 RepID=A0ABS7Z9S7_9SPHI|nr:FecR family protein [Sphingobacterium bovistauri]MCA5005635.1 FecR family protein [Sphingobacterium bovistauri]
MHNLDNNFKKITNYLNNDESSLDKKDVVDWYDSLSNHELVDTERVDTIRYNAKQKLLQTIQQNKRKTIVNAIIKYGVVAAIFIAIGSFSYIALNSKEPNIISTKDKLSSISSAQNKAIIILPNGKEIDLEKIKLNESIDLGHTILKKDGNGKVSYYDKLSNKEIVQNNTLKIPKGGTYTLTLSDGTKVQLNSDSKITYPTTFSKGDRVVSLEGEAYFEVSKTSNRSPFKVFSKNQQVEVLGTKFNIKAYPNQEVTQTTLEEGSVSVSTNIENNKILKPEEQSTVLNKGNISIRNVVLDEVLSWTKNQFYFNGSNTKDVMDDIARWYNVDINYIAKNRTADYVGKIPRNLPLDKLIELLKFADFTVKINEEKDKSINLIIN